jgi:Na+:H+ antiporter, NhaA family
MSTDPSHAPHPALGPLRFISVEAASGIVLLLAAALALAWANSPWAGAYQALWHMRLPLALPGVLPAQDLHFWVNDGLMTVFFLVVGLEIRRELHEGALSDLKVATLPAMAALGGVVVPALLYLLVSALPAGEPLARRGWAIPTATDIAFAVGVLSLTGKGVPPAVRMLLLTLAIVDDIVAIVVIALFYSPAISATGLAVGAAGVLVALTLQWLSVGSALPYLLPAAVVWLGMLQAGVHPALTGVVLGLVTPVTVTFGRGMRAARAQSPPDAVEPPVVRMEELLHPWVAFGIMPLFAIANAGVALAGVNLGVGAPRAAAAGIVLGLTLGKPLGIVLASFAAVSLGLCALPKGARWSHIGLLGVMGGIGFTMSIFITELAFDEPELVATAKFAVLIGSALAGTIGLIVGRLQPGSAPLTARA